VVGADGKRSLVAKSVAAQMYFEKPGVSAAYYGYWEGLGLGHGEFYERHRRSIGVWPTSDGQTVIYLGLPIADFAAFRSDVPGNFFKSLELAGNLAERARSARQVGRFMGSANLANWFRKPYGPGWALAGDTGLLMDPISGQGIGHAFRDAELLSDAIEVGFGQPRKLEQAMGGYEKERNRQSIPMYKMTLEQAAMGPRSCKTDALYRSLQGKPAEIDAFFGMLTGSVPINDYLSLWHMVPLLGARGIAAIALGMMPWRRRALEPAKMQT
jgi:2-polyprenyl-6-methoxyphenol hydroxylase-like FAD-dependent oxidoreductase